MECKVTRKVLGFYINAVAYRIGIDLVVMVYGGENGHVGGVSIASPNDKVQSLSLFTHKDDIISEIYAKKLAADFSCNVSVICGIHYENPTKQDINTIVSETEELLEKLVSKLMRNS